MCGFAGLLNVSWPQEKRLAALQKMCSRLSHRGPDDSGVYQDERADLGHRRLSVIDLEGSRQPMVHENGSLVLVYNGEVYNFRELKANLEKRGLSVQSRGDTEVILKMYALYGEDFLQHLRGMFALALWDKTKGRLLLARDRLGIKPLYYAATQKGFVFASELKALTASGLVGDALDFQALDDFFAFSYIRAPRSILKDVKKLESGCLLRIQLPDSPGPVSFHKKKYWDLPCYSPDLPGATPSYGEAKEQLTSLLDEAVRLRLIADVPLGAFLSGGVDSSAVVWFMTRQHPKEVKTFSIGFEEEAFDESPYSRELASHFGIHHTEERVRPDSSAILPDVLWHHDEPFADPSSLPTWYLCQMARKHVTVCLSGDGGDELFAGYTRHPMFASELTRRNSLPRFIRRLLAVPASFWPESSRMRNILERQSLPAGRAYGHFRATFGPGLRGSMYSRELLKEIDIPSTQDLMKHLNHWNTDPLTLLQFIDMATYLPEDILTKVDRMSMAHSLEARVPLLDHKVVEFVATLPPHYKYNDKTSKKILRDIVEPALPPGFLDRRKQGFSIPLNSWFANELADKLHEALHGQVYRESGWFHPETIHQLFERHKKGKQDLSWALWQLLIFHVWHEETLPRLFE